MQGGDQVTVTLTNGPGGDKDWLGFVAVGTPDGPGKYLQWVYVGAGVTTRTWTVDGAVHAGAVRVPLLRERQLRACRHQSRRDRHPAACADARGERDDGRARRAGDRDADERAGGAKDWLGFTAVSAPDGSGQYLQWVYVGAGMTTRTWTVTVPTTPGQYEFRFFPNDTYTRLATSPTVTVPAPPPPPPGSTPVLTVSPTTVPAGGQVTVTLTNGPGGAKDWLGFAAVGTPDGPGSISSGSTWERGSRRGRGRSRRRRLRGSTSSASS